MTNMNQSPPRPPIVPAPPPVPYHSDASAGDYILLACVFVAGVLFVGGFTAVLWKLAGKVCLP